MEEIYPKQIEKIKKHKTELEKKLNLKIEIDQNKVTLSGETLNEFYGRIILESIDFGFSVKKALLLKNETYVFKTVHIRDHTKRNLETIKGRIIGRLGKTKKTISEISNCNLIIKEGEIGIIGDAENVENVTTSLINLIKGSKQSNAYRYLENMNRIKKEEGPEFNYKNK